MDSGVEENPSTLGGYALCAGIYRRLRWA